MFVRESFQSGRVMERSEKDIEMIEYYTMLILNFSIKNVKQRSNRLSFDQNLLEDTDYIKKEGFCEIDQNNIKAGLSPSKNFFLFASVIALQK